jgi:hypothetical protein
VETRKIHEGGNPQIAHSNSSPELVATTLFPLWEFGQFRSQGLTIGSSECET